ncbi:MAG TPA: cation:proton antiporter [Thermomicrobiales bacterium]|nr:cation:proton antiporter [Thermomicrobiales bacterium]
MGSAHDLIVTAAAVLAATVVVQVLAGRTKVPSILLYLGVGVLLGPIGFGLIAADKLGPTLEAAIKISVAIIVFEGAFSLEWTYLRIVSKVVRNLVSIGAAITVVVGALAAHYIAGLSWELAALFGALVMVTGPTAIGPLLQRVRVTGRARATLSGEGVIIDPIGAIVTLMLFELFHAPNGDVRNGAVWALERIGFGALAGAVGAFLMLIWLRYFVVEQAQIARISLLAGSVGIFTVSDSIVFESGLTAVVVGGILLGNMEFPHRAEAHRFKGDITAIVIASVYLLLAATLHPEDLTRLGWKGPATVLVMMVVARPLAVLASTIRSPLTWRERAFVAAIGPRGVVAASLATFVAIRLRESDPQGAAALLGLVFLTITMTIAVQATYADWVANKLGVRPMGVLIIGGGRVGRMLAERLIGANEDVTIVEIDAEQAEKSRQLGAHVVIGDATLPATLERAGIEYAQTVVATTRSDKDNLLACQLARTRYDREHVVSRVTDPDSLPSFEELGIRAMNPAAATAMILSNLVRRPGIFSLLSGNSSRDDADVAEVVVSNDDIAGKSLKDLAFPGDSLVLLIRRGGTRLIPHGGSTLEPGDVVTIVGTNGATGKAAAMLSGRSRVGG